MIFQERKDRLPGGLADKSKPSDFDSKELAMGVEVEMEHTKDKDLALEIAMDHLKEDPRYYTKLKKVHREGIMDIGQFLGLLENLRYELSEAGPPPVDPSARRAKGLKPLGKDDDTSKALSGLRKMHRSDTDKALDTVKSLSKKSAAAKKAKPPRLPKEVRLAKSEKARSSPEALKRQAYAHEKLKSRIKAGRAGKPTHGTGGLGIKRSFKMHSATGKVDPKDSGGNVQTMKRVVDRRASHGESVFSALHAAILEAMKSVKPTGEYSGYLPGVHAKPPPTPGSRRTKLRVAGKEKKKPDETAQALSVVRKLAKGGKVESFSSAIGAIRSLLEAEGREFGGPKLTPRERKAKGLSGRTSKLSKKMQKIWR